MEFVSTSSVIDRAKEELEILETHHPNGFNYLKSELKIFISAFHSHNFPPCDNDVTAPLPASSSALTQESSTGKKRKGKWDEDGGEEEALNTPKAQKVGSKVDAVLQRAQRCIYKIRRLKSTL